ncbi:MAG: hypothetical protein ACI9V1_000894 [Spirosomataceae bacterium]|jgi:hypothetical protein
MGMSIKLYPINSDISRDNFDAIAKEIETNNEREVDLYKITPDLYMLLSNTPEPFGDSDSIESFALLGRKSLTSDEDFEIKYGFQLNSYLNEVDVKEVYQWIQEKKLDSESGFYSHFEALDDNVKEMIDSFGSPIEELCSYFQDLTALYKFASQNNHYVVVVIQ